MFPQEEGIDLGVVVEAAQGTGLGVVVEAASGTGLGVVVGQVAPGIGLGTVAEAAQGTGPGIAAEAAVDWDRPVSAPFGSSHQSQESLSWWWRSLTWQSVHSCGP